MRIASLVPSATEMAFALGLGPEVVAVTHECDFPLETKHLPRLTSSVIPPDLDPAEIDAAVRGRVESGQSLYELDTETLAKLDPELIVTQQLCAVCAVSSDDVRAIAAELPSKPRVLSQDPSKLGDVLDDAVVLAEAAGKPDLGATLRAGLKARIDWVRAATAAKERPRVAAIEWLDPPYCAGHWLPEMIEAAGGVDALARPGERSRTLSWEQIAAAEPDVVVVMPCGLHAEEAAEEAARHLDSLNALGAERIYAVDAAASYSRPGPRLADGVELLGHLLHPGPIPAPASLGFTRIERVRSDA